MFEQHLAELKEQLVKATQFSAVYTYFFDHLGENPAFLQCGQSEDNQFLQSVLPAVAGELSRKSVEIVQMVAVRVPDHPFLHGSCMFSGFLMTFFYFEDIATGLAAVTTMERPKDMQFIRFSGRRFMPTPAPSMN